MKILVATGLYPPEIGGPATYAVMLEEELSRHIVTVQTVPFNVVRHHHKIIRHLVYAYRLWRESKDVDIVYALDPISVGVPALIVARLRKKSFIIRLGGDYAWEQGRIRFGLTETLDEYLARETPLPWPVRFLAVVQTFVVSRAKRVIAPSEYLKSVISRWGIDEKKITVIYSALLPLSVAETKKSLRKQLEYTSPTIVSAGRLVPWKGFSALIQAVAELKTHYPALTLVVLGDGPERQSLERLAHELNVEDSVRFVGQVGKEALGAAIKAADVFVLNTAYEGLSHQLLEVMDIGTPIVTTPAGGNTELIVDGETGWLVTFDDTKALADGIKRVLDNPAEAEHMVAAARNQVRKFHKEEVIGQLLKVLKDFQR